MAHCQWIADTTNLIILGTSSVGKTYLAQALVNAACRKDYTCRFWRTDELASTLAVMDIHDPERQQFLTKLVATGLLILDDFLTTPISGETANQLFNIIAAREHKGSTMITSQFTPDEWYKSIPDAVIAESLLNRLIGKAEILNLNGPNMRLEN